MPMISVKLRVVGIYFNRKIEFEVGEKPTIENLLDAAKEQLSLGKPGGFHYETDPDDSNSIGFFAHNFSGLYDFNGNGKTERGEGETHGGNEPVPGLYMLKEQEIRGGYLAWQSYIIRGGKPAGQTTKPKGFVYFKDKEIKDEDVVIWRLVAIGEK
jgi:hypothetical protein